MRPPPRATRTRSGACSRAAAPAAAEAEIDDSCVICGNDESEPFDLIVFCDGCNVTVCQSCYSIADVPEGDWFCRPCEAGVRDSKRRLDVTCKLCERQGGALEPTMCGGWVHTACCQCFEEVFLVDLGDGRSAASLTKLYRERRRGFACSLCPRKGGWCITCPRGTCKTAFHPACARERAERDGLVTYVQELPNGQPIVRICCAEHSRKLGGKPPAGVRMPKSCRALPGGMDAPDSNPTVRCDADAPPGGPERGERAACTGAASCASRVLDDASRHRRKRGLMAASARRFVEECLLRPGDTAVLFEKSGFERFAASTAHLRTARSPGV